MRTRWTLGLLGAVLASYGAFRLLTQQNAHQILTLGKWLIGAVILHDVVLAPITMAVGALLTAVVRPRVRSYVQGALIAAGLVTVVAIPLIYRRGSQIASKSLEQQDYGAHLGWLLAIIASTAGVSYLVRVVRDRVGQHMSAIKVRPPADQTSDLE